jgi:hypothetical protein
LRAILGGGGQMWARKGNGVNNDGILNLEKKKRNEETLTFERRGNMSESMTSGDSFVYVKMNLL